MGDTTTKSGVGENALSQDKSHGLDTSDRAMSPRSPVLILMASSSGMMKILPSPISPVRAACRIAATAFSTYYLFIGLYYQLFHFVNFGCKITTL